jgi:hypothetical protein
MTEMAMVSRWRREVTMTANRTDSYAIGNGICKISLVLIGLGVCVQLLDNFFYRQPFDRLFGLGAAFVLTFTLCRTFRIMELKAVRSADSRIRYDAKRDRLLAATQSDRPG